MALCPWLPSQSHLVTETDEVQSSYVDWRRRGRWGGVTELESGGTGINDSDPLMNDVWVQHKSPLGWDCKHNQ